MFTEIPVPKNVRRRRRPEHLRVEEEEEQEAQPPVSSTTGLASFPSLHPAFQLDLLQAMKSWVGPGNKAKQLMLSQFYIFTMQNQRSNVGKHSQVAMRSE